ncbi:biotin-dependent carboxyltransferase family protein [Desulfuribacillus alkaliarsenatis]|uniref:Carboxyltransferase domain-containing protein n=1 Tax=Desulfuribacillus alkaliarsenatis TaxID=766136 RepID=A0A1E5FYI7_9FIRM|nr:biotin-dependent carboxyltransferase family protein [Desulfuribacillus alkaliarsenatis]OEF95629.1 hypothetical protein BHF68_12355 [Desulfuribacillus alkaliarsenatis]
MNNQSVDVCATATIEKAGLYDTLQDNGRYGYRSKGVPVSGAMDNYSYTIGNLLLGNYRNDPSIEITMVGPTISFSQPTEIVITGADFRAMINEKPAKLWQRIKIQAEDILTFSQAKQGCRAYLAVKGGFQVPQVLGSVATYTKAKLGGLAGKRLQVGDKICYRSSNNSKASNNSFKKAFNYQERNYHSLSYKLRPNINIQDVELRVILGPQQQYFAEESVQALLSNSYQVTKDIDRMGIRLQGKPLEFKASPHQAGGQEIITDAVAYGAIQVPANGQPVILGVDSQTTGGYAKIACVISADLPKVAQLRHLQHVYFTAVSIEEAQAIYKKQELIYSTLEGIING